jgi:hypothetical protein
MSKINLKTISLIALTIGCASNGFSASSGYATHGYYNAGAADRAIAENSAAHASDRLKAIDRLIFSSASDKDNAVGHAAAHSMAMDAHYSNLDRLAAAAFIKGKIPPAIFDLAAAEPNQSDPRVFAILKRLDDPSAH